ncbi:hypothetical protein [Chitinophaga solisilvae]|uniref:Uncharacterized protein n=1 Tax=Chitinophaga solisilvae TaxID=1233460 RepID=A0A433WI12_9BACT|nr:hypothetical protein [Chitinophaga solisilvae]NSL87662.1 hypothetical protein [Chitinophaga solisilvae]
MKIYQVTSSGKQYSLSANEEVQGQISYPTWYSYRAVITTANGTWNVKTEGFWGQKLLMEKDNGVVADARINWNAQVVITFGSREYLLKVKRFLDFSFVVLNEKKEVVMNIRSQYKWTGCHVNYQLETEADFLPEELLFLAHNCNMLLAMNGDATASVAATI